jgi:hypothetical protein
MTTNLVSTIAQVLTSDVAARLASNLGIDRAQVESSFRAGIPGILAALTSLVSKPAGASMLDRAVSQQEPGLLNNLASMLGGPAQATLIDNGTSTLTSLLGGATMSALTSAVGRYVGLGTETSKHLMGLLGPVALGVLGQQKRASGLDASGLASLLTSQKDSISRAMPAGFADYLSGTGILDRVAPTTTTTTTRINPSSYASPQLSSRNLGWILPALAILALGGLAWYMFHTPTETVATLPPAKVEAPIRAPDRATIIVTADQVKDWIARPVYSRDNKKVGEIVEIRRDPENKFTEAFIDTGNYLGIGAVRYRITSDQIQEVKAEGVVLKLNETDVKDAAQKEQPK